jgi:hypothetical protein
LIPRNNPAQKIDAQSALTADATSTAPQVHRLPCG